SWRYRTSALTCSSTVNGELVIIRSRKCRAEEYLRPHGSKTVSPHCKKRWRASAGVADVSVPIPHSFAVPADFGRNVKKRVLVLGAGVTGVVTAWYLTQKGHDVTVVEASDSVASGTSRANAGQLSYSFTDAVARPEFLRKMPALLAGKDAGSLVRLKPDAAFLRWGRQFLRQCTKVRARDNTFAVLEVAMRSAALMERLMQAEPLEFDFARAGNLVLLSLPDEVARARKSVLLKREYGCVTEVVTRSEALVLEPALAAMRGDFSAAT